MRIWFAATLTVLAAGFAPGSSNIGTFTLPRTTSFGSFAPAATYYVRLAAFNVRGTSPATWRSRSP